MHYSVISVPESFLKKHTYVQLLFVVHSLLIESESFCSTEYRNSPKKKIVGKQDLFEGVGQLLRTNLVVLVGIISVQSILFHNLFKIKQF